jgi:hypothetical protein
MAGQPLQKFMNLFKIPQGIPGRYKIPTFGKWQLPLFEYTFS